MTHSQLTKAMTKMGISQIALATALGATDRAVRMWMTGTSPVPVAVSMLINLMIDTGKTLEDLRA